MHLCKPVTSNQAGPHPELNSLVLKHLSSSYLRPIAQHSLESFDSFQNFVATSPIDLQHNLLLDTGCGVGHSSLNLAIDHPQSLVIGIDKSIVRLTKSPQALPPNLLYLRSDLVDFWRLFEQHGYRALSQFAFYPNPWPLSSHVKRRWHGHPIWPSIIKAGGTIELRTNWDVYALEFAQALEVSGFKAKLEPWVPTRSISLFEKKYQASGHDLWRVVAQNPAFLTS